MFENTTLSRVRERQCVKDADSCEILVFSAPDLYNLAQPIFLEHFLSRR